MKIYFVGIGGIGISGLAQLCLSFGDEISGSNQGRTKMFDVLESKNIKVYDFHDEKFLEKDVDLLVYVQGVPENNPERKKAFDLKIPQKTYFEYLGELSHKFKTIAVAGTHGKTTTTGLIASGLIRSGIKFTALVGSTLKEFGDNNFYESDSNFEEGSLLLVEACEYRNNFEFLAPETVILTNVELDHIDFYKSESHYFETFESFCEKSKKVIFHDFDKNSEKVLKNFSGEKIKVHFENYNFEKLSLSGIHNRQNAGLALALGENIFKNIKNLSGGNLDDFLEKYNKGILEFGGAGRRQEFLGEVIIEDKKINVFDDYGHHPTEIEVTLQSFREKFPTQNIGLIFEPHQYSRTKEFFEDFLKSFESADFMGIFPIYEARDTEEDKKAISRKDFVAKNKNISLIDSQKDILSFVENLKSGDVLLFMGAGNISAFAHEFMKNN